MRSLLNALWLRVRTNEGVENSQNVAAVIHHARKDVAKLRIAFCFAMPLGEDDRRHFDVSPQFVRRMAPQEQPVKKSGLTLRKVEIMHDFGAVSYTHLTLPTIYSV